MQRTLALIFPDRFIAVLLATVALAVIFPMQGQALVALGWVSTVTIVTLFFVHGARLSRNAVIGGFKSVRLHVTILAFTFLAFPLFGIALTGAIGGFLNPAFIAGILFLCALPSTVASSIAATSMAKGNVAASVISAAFSNMLGVIVTPLIFALLLSTSGAPIGLGGIGKVVMILAVPFAVGQLFRPLAGATIEAHPVIAKTLDRATILLAVYVALSGAATSGLLSDIAMGDLVALAAAMLALLAIVIVAAALVGRALGFSYEDRMPLIFNGIQKSVVSGTPMARVLFPGAEAGLIIVPLLVYYVPMLTVSAIMAARLGAARDD